MRHALALGLLAVLAGVVAPAAAFASAAGVQNSTAYLSALPREANDVTVSTEAGSVTFRDRAGITARSGCEQVAADTARCPGGASFPVSISVGDNNDRVLVDDTLAKYSIIIDGGPGDDRLETNSGAAFVIGGPGADDLLGADTIADYERVTSGPVNVTLDGLANDGNADDESGGRRDNVGFGASVKGTPAGDHLVGDAMTNSLTGEDGGDEIAGGGGDDFLNGGLGDDTLTGGKGRDTISGSNGNDAIDARDGEADKVSCDSGTDRATTDALTLDSVNLQNCEQLDNLAGPCEAMDRFNAKHSRPATFGARSRPAAGGLYVGKTSWGLPVRLNVARNRLGFVPASRLTYKWCYKARVASVDVKFSHDAIHSDGSFDITHRGLNRLKTNHIRRIRGHFYDHGREVSGVITDRHGSTGHGGPVTFVARLTPRS